MARKPLSPITFGVVYFTALGAINGVATIEARDYWAACKIAWKEVRKARKQIAEFQLIEEPSLIAAGPQHVRAAAVEIVAMRDDQRRAAA